MSCEFLKNQLEIAIKVRDWIVDTTRDKEKKYLEGYDCECCWALPKETNRE